MKIIVIKLLLLLLFIPELIHGINNQPEKIAVFTDRNLYICNEKILFTATIQSNNTNKAEFSSVLYVELISPDGESFSKSKFAIKNSISNGSILIPGNMLSGIYYLKTYTKWMRNFGPESYSYTLIKVVNPFKNGILNIDQKSYKIKSYIDSSNVENTDVQIIIPKTSFSTRESTNLSVKVKEKIKDDIQTMSISVAPKGTVINTIVLQNTDSLQNKEIDYKPETKGISLSGKVLSSKNKPLINTRVNLSVIGNNDIITQYSDSMGKFNFGFLDYYNSKDLFISAESKDDNETPKLLIDNDFCNKEIAIQFHPFTLSETEKTTVLKMAQNLQVDSLYNNDTIKTADFESEYTQPFYGKPSKSIYFDKYVLLPTIDEYFSEFIGDVAIKKRNGKRYFKIQGFQSAMQIYDPLVMIDFIAIENHDLLLSINPQNISHVEIINEPYVKGSATYGGVISFISKKRNFAGIELPKSGLFINYSFYKPISNINTDDFVAKNPDARNTLLWVTTNNFGKPNNDSFTLKTGDTPCDYTIIVKCIDKSGNVYSTSKTISVLE